MLAMKADKRLTDAKWLQQLPWPFWIKWAKKKKKKIKKLH